MLAGTPPRVRPPATVGTIEIFANRAWHDEHQGRLRGGATDILWCHTRHGVVVHLGDLGERPAGPLLDRVSSEAIEVLIVPVGGYFTIGPDAAAELVGRLRPRVVIPCHSSDDGVRLPPLGPRDAFLRRVPSLQVERRPVLSLDSLPDTPTVVLLDRPPDT